MSNENRSTPRPSRRAFLGGAVALGAALALPVPPAAARTDAVISKRTREFRTSLSVSPFTDAVLESVSLGDGHRRAYAVRQMQELFNRHGATEVYVRVATLRNAHLSDAEYGVAGVAVRSFGSTDYQPPDAVDPAIGQTSVGQLLAMAEADRIGWLQTHLWPYVGRLLAAVAHGVRSVDRAAKFSTHTSGLGIENGAYPIAFWEAMSQAVT